ncbi:hypothetical protein, partial [Sulfurimonas sp.]|uniref:hypothetical protein n=1 Tax=Sulfurimonas sp. TaxID=2022749 RepID=UPI003D0C4216
PSIKKEATPKCKGLKRKTSDEKENSKAQRVQKRTYDEKRGDLTNQKSGTVSSPKPASLN